MHERKIQLFKEDDTFVIRHYLSKGRVFDDQFTDAATFLERVGVFLYTSENTYQVAVEREIEPLVFRYLAGLVEIASSEPSGTAPF